MQKHLPGRLGDPAMTLLTDPRMNPRVAEFIRATGDEADTISPPQKDATYEQCLSYCERFEMLAAMSHPLAEAAMPDFSDVQQTVEVVRGVDGNDIKLYVHQPKNRDQSLPCVLHTHGGGMVLMTAQDPGCVRWRNALA